jgi:hypothetical protein
MLHITTHMYMHGNRNAVNTQTRTCTVVPRAYYIYTGKRACNFNRRRNARVLLKIETEIMVTVSSQARLQ